MPTDLEPPVFPPEFLNFLLEHALDQLHRQPIQQPTRSIIDCTLVILLHLAYAAEHQNQVTGVHNLLLSDCVADLTRSLVSSGVTF